MTSEQIARQVAGCDTGCAYQNSSSCRCCAWYHSAKKGAELARKAGRAEAFGECAEKWRSKIPDTSSVLWDVAFGSMADWCEAKAREG
jgi:hypothetical protein